MAKDAEESLKLVEDFKKRLDELEGQFGEFTTKTLNDSLEGMIGDLKKAYRRYKETDGQSGARVAGEQAKRLSDVIDVAEDLLSPDEVDHWKDELETFLNESDKLGQDLAKTLSENESANRIRQGVREQIASAATSATKWLDYETEKTRKGVVGLVTEGVVRGWGPKRLAEEIARTLPQLKGQIEIVARTEMATAYLEAQRRMSKRLGHDFVRWVATEDERTCPNCASRSGLIFRLEEVVMPAHPLCRCAMVPVPNKVVEAEDASLLNEEKWGEHREQVLREFVENKARKFPNGNWTVDKAMDTFDKHRKKPTPFELRARPHLGVDESAKPVRVLGETADPGIDWQLP